MRETHNIKRDRLALNFFFLYFIYISLYGIVVKLTYSNSTLFTIKTYIPELILVLSVTPLLLKKHYVRKQSFILLLYMGFILILNYLLHGATTQSFYWWRDLVIPVVVAVIVYDSQLDRDEVEYFLHKFAVYGRIYLLAGFILALAENRLGWEWTSTFYTGHSFYGRDPNSSLLVNTYLGFVRTPGLSANFTSFAFYSCLCLFSILQDEKDNQAKSKFWKLFWIILAFFVCVLSTNKSAILGLSIVLLVSKANEFRGINKIVANGLLVISGLLLILSVLVSDDFLDNLETMLTGSLERFDVWGNILGNTSIIEMLLPYNMFLYGTSTDSGLYGSSFFDNFYLYMLMSQGIVWLILIISNIRAIYKKVRARREFLTMFLYTVFFGAVIGLTSNMIQGRAYFPVALIFIAYLGACEGKQKVGRE